MSEYAVITGPVVEGQKIARRLGYPTMNLGLSDDCSLKYGIYAGVMEHQGLIYPGAINIGVTPNHPTAKPKLEIHVFGFDKEIYGEVIKVTLMLFLRDEMKFASIEELVEQIEKDCIAAKQFLRVYHLMNFLMPK